MRKLLLSVVVATVAIMTTGCGKINDKIDRLDERLSQLEGTTIPTIDEQITNINTSIGDLERTDTELKGYIASLQETATDLQKQITATNTKIDGVNSALAQSIADAKTDLASQIATAKSDVVAQLEALRTEMTAQLAQINTTIETLQSKDAELEGKITALQAYVDTQIGSAKDWATATFATLEQYNKVVEDIAAIKTSIESTNQSIADLETRLNGKIATDIATAVASLDEEIKQKVSEITAAYTSAITTAKDEITAAYTAAMAQAISASETSMKAWVNEQLTGYYTIAQTDAKLDALKTDLEGQLSTQKTYLENLIAQLSTTVNQQIADNTAKIEALRTELSGKIDKNKTAIADNAEKIAKNAEAIVANTKGIADNAELIKANAALIEANSRLIEANKTAIAELNENVDKNAKAVAKNAQAIADNASLISTNTTTLNNHTQTIAENSAAIVKLQSDLADAKTQITEAYTNAIATAVAESEGRINTKIANEIAGVNTTIDNKIKSVNESVKTLSEKVTALESEVASIKSQIATMAQEIEAIKGDIAKLLKRIQSVTFVPQYTDGKVEMKRIVTEDDGIAEFDFAVTPAEAVKELANVWQQAVTMQAVYTKTRTVSFIDLPIISLTANKRTGVITIKASGKNLSEDFFLKKTSANASLVISDGNASVASEYVPMYGKDDTSLVDDLYTILYTTSDNKSIYSKIATQEGFVSNTYENGQGTIRFDRKITELCMDAFKDCKTLTSITLPNSLEKIGWSAFESCSSLVTITIPDSVKEIDYRAFEYCYNLANINIPDGISKIESLTFDYCRNLTSINIPNSVKSIDSRAFDNCTGLTKVNITDVAAWCSIIFESGFLSHAYELYLNDELVTDIVISNNATRITDGAFRYCSNLRSITIPDSVTTIGKDAFQYCSNLQMVIIGQGVTGLGENLFDGCTKLEHIYGKFASEDGRCLIFDNELRYCASYGLTEYTIPNNITTIGEYAFYKNQSLTNIVISEGVTNIGKGAFNGCQSLTSVIIPNGVTSIEPYTFSGCQSLASVVIPNSVTYIGYYAFSVSGIIDLTIPNSVETIDQYAFYKCESLNSVAINGTGQSIIKEAAFRKCTNLKTVEISGVKSTDVFIFRDCSSLEKISFLDDIEYIGQYLCLDCTSLKEVYVKSTTPHELRSDAFTYTTYNGVMENYQKLNCKIYVPTAAIDAYKSAAGWSEYSSQIEGYDFE